MDRLLLDTTYLLPVLGIRVRLREFEALFLALLGAYSVIYNPVSIVEAKWIVLKSARRMPQRRGPLFEAFRRGLRALLSDERLSQTILTNADMEEVADRLLADAGLGDYFDRMIYATAAHHDAILLTEDAPLMEIARRSELPKPKEVISWSDLAERLG